jgi:opacity protein-like surface antigen
MKKMIIAAAAAALASTAAYAAVTFEPSTGAGFVGKGDVQLAYGWNNSALQNKAAAVSFNYVENDHYDVTCEWDTVTGGKKSKTIHHSVTVKRKTKLNSAVAYDLRLRNQITGFTLKGFSSSDTTGTEPSIGDTCQANGDEEVGNGAVVTAVALDQTTGGLFVNHAEGERELAF